jgi:xylulose-5-phosphate/fructose-6-phosphate phosphoketolase
MVVLNGISRDHLALEALHGADGCLRERPQHEEHCRAMLARHRDYIREHFEDLPEIRDWAWADS